MPPRLRGVKGHLRLVEEDYDPTPEELAKLERAKPTRVPRCAKCKLFPVANLREGSAHRAILENLELVLKSSRSLKRDETEKLFLAHLHVTRASKGRYCARCVNGSIIFADQTLEYLGAPKPKPESFKF
jgi:hypothetical protein